ncbi:SLU7 [Symbiodinium natans]|uniref:SLU7 protein n=1 Tax=Symbiodinium natans TaxID=878477 RepID=A0A812SEQ7_9DINO|nr:SLU7 [Symbiodinium natans]
MDAGYELQRSLATSRYAEDAIPLGHASVWGSWFCTKTQSWGFACCRATDKEAKPCKPEAALAMSEPEEPQPSPRREPKASSEPEWLPRSSFETSVGFLTHSLEHFLSCWRRGLQEPASASRLQGLGSGSSNLTSEKSVAEAARAVEELCRKLGAQRLSVDLLRKLEEMVVSIGDREYANANKIYMDLVIGTKKWLNDMPYMAGVATYKRWVVQCESEYDDKSGRDKVWDCSADWTCTVLKGKGVEEFAKGVFTIEELRMTPHRPISWVVPRNKGGHHGDHSTTPMNMLPFLMATTSSAEKFNGVRDKVGCADISDDTRLHSQEAEGTITLNFEPFLPNEDEFLEPEFEILQGAWYRRDDNLQVGECIGRRLIWHVHWRMPETQTELEIMAADGTTQGTTTIKITLGDAITFGEVNGGPQPAIFWQDGDVWLKK